MSVALMIENINGLEVNHYLPVSNQQFFVEYWVPLCKKHQLFLVPLFESGLSLTDEDLPDLLRELKTLQSQPEYDDEYFQKRINLLINELENLSGKNVSFFIG